MRSADVFRGSHFSSISVFCACGITCTYRLFTLWRILSALPAAFCSHSLRSAAVLVEQRPRMRMSLFTVLDCGRLPESWHSRKRSPFIPLHVIVLVDSAFTVFTSRHRLIPAGHSPVIVRAEATVMQVTDRTPARERERKRWKDVMTLIEKEYEDGTPDTPRTPDRRIARNRKYCFMIPFRCFGLCLPLQV